MQVTYTHCAGLDVHKKTVVACCITLGAKGEKQIEIRTFETMTADLLALSDWLTTKAVTHVAMESTGEFWKPVYNILEGNFELLVVNAKHIKNVPGRKTDVKDAEWIADLLRHGLLRGSFIPPQAQRDLRDLTRQRTNLVQDRATVVNRLQKVLEWANLKLSSVATDVTGVSARAMLEAILAGKTTPATLAALAKGRLRNKRSELERALHGIVRNHHRFLLAQHLAQLDFLDEQIAQFDTEIERQMTSAVTPSATDAAPTAAPTDAPTDALTDTPTDAPTDALTDTPTDAPTDTPTDAPTDAPTDTPTDAPTDAPTDTPTDTPIDAPQATVAPLTWPAAVALLDTIPGVNRRTAELLLAEIGPDMRRFPSAAHLVSWAKVAPGNNESAGKRYSGATGQGNRWLRTGIIQAAWAAVKVKKSYLSAFYHRLAGRRGAKRAIVAVAHRMLTAVYHMLTKHEAFHDLGATYLDERNETNLMNRTVKRFAQLGYQVNFERLQPA